MSELNSDRSIGRESIPVIDTSATRKSARKVDHADSGDGYHLGMRPITDIRRDRLRQMIDEVADGNQAEFAGMIGKSRAYVGFWLTDPAKPHAKQISHEVAREVEATLTATKRGAYPPGWLDTDPQSQPVIPDMETLKWAEGMVQSKEAQRGKFEDIGDRAYELVEAYKLLVKHEREVPRHALERFMQAKRGVKNGRGKKTGEAARR